MGAVAAVGGAAHAGDALRSACVARGVMDGTVTTFHLAPRLRPSPRPTAPQAVHIVQVRARAAQPLSAKGMRGPTSLRTRGRDVPAMTAPQHLDADYGLFVWPAALLLADYVWAHSALVSGRAVVEVRTA